MKEIKRCPFCGERPTLYNYPFSDIIKCENPWCPVNPAVGVGHDYCKHTDEAIEKWNTREG